jgi:hypothetical protein
LQGFVTGDVIGLLLDCDAGTLTIKKNGNGSGSPRLGWRGSFAGRRRWENIRHYPALSGSRQPTRRRTAGKVQRGRPVPSVNTAQYSVTMAQQPRARGHMRDVLRHAWKAP